MRISAEEKRRRWDAGQKRKMEEMLGRKHRKNLFDGEEYEGVTTTEESYGLSHSGK